MPDVKHSLSAHSGGLVGGDPAGGASHLSLRLLRGLSTGTDACYARAVLGFHVPARGPDQGLRSRATKDWARQIELSTFSPALRKLGLSDRLLDIYAASLAIEEPSFDVYAASLAIEAA